MRAGTDTWQLAAVETTLQPGDAIKAGSGSKAEITFFEGSTIELEANAEISVSDIGISETGSTKIRLAQKLGKTISRVKKLVDAESSYEIETPAAIAAVRGSTMVVTVDSTGKTVVANEGGDIRIIVDGQEYIVREGMQRTVIPGQPPGGEVPINPPSGGGGGGPSIVYQAILVVTMLAEPAQAHVGENITYTCYLKNTGNLPFHDITVSSDVAGNATYQSGDTDHNVILNPAETWVYVSYYTVKESDPSLLVATATISALTPSSVKVTTTETASTPIVHLAVDITSPADGATVDSRTIQISGTVSDNNITEGTITINGESHAIAIVEGTFSTSENVINGPNTITVTVTDGEGNTGSDTIIINAEITPYAIRIELTWDTSNTDMDSHFIRPGSTYGDAVGDCNYDNPSPDWGLPEVGSDNATLDQDDTEGYGPENITLEDPYEEGIYQYKVQYFNDFGHGPSNATVRIWINGNKVAEFSEPLAVGEVWDCAYIDWPSGTVSQMSPAIAIDKAADRSEAYVGDNITYTYAVTNIGNTPLADVTVTDNKLGEIISYSGDTDGDTLLDIDETWVFTDNYTTLFTDTGLLENTANASGWDNLEREVIATDSTQVTVLTGGITLEKTAGHTMAHVGDNITYTYAVTALGNYSLFNVHLNDEHFPEEIPLDSGDNNENGDLDTYETWVYTANYTVTGVDPDLLVNTANATGMDNWENDVMASDSASVAILRPAMSLEKTADPSVDVGAGDTITYSFAIFNNSIQLTDEWIVSITRISNGNGDEVLDTGETWEYTATYTVTEEDSSPIENTASVAGWDELGLEVTASDSASVSLSLPL